jgi:tetratricopeptide (TPR) repeat protein
MVGPILGAILIAAFLTPLPPSPQAGTRTQPTPVGQSQEVNELAKAATDALRKGDYAAAIPRLEKLTATAPNVAEFQADLGMAYYSARRPQDAIAPCRKALKLKPSLAFAQYFLALSLSEAGDCKGALPLLEKDYPRVEDASLRRVVGLDGARCAMSAGEPDKAINFLQWLKHDFAKDPEVLYLRMHIFSELSTSASQELMLGMADSYQARQMRAEVLEMQGKTSEAIAEYREILAKEPQVPGIHYQVGRLLLAGKRDPATEDAARREFEEELQLNAADEGAEYELGELAREARQWDEAIQHFGRAVRIDPRFHQALIGSGKSLLSAGRAAEAIGPLEKAASVAPGEAVAHYQLSFAYLRVGRGAEAKREMALFQEIQERQEHARQVIRHGALDNISRPQTAEPPE